MNELVLVKSEIETNGFAVLENIFSDQEVAGIVYAIDRVSNTGINFRKSGNLFAIRQFLKEVPGVQEFIFNDKLKTIISSVFGNEYFVVKSIYFDKPAESNWFVAWHQDITISVDKKIEAEGFGAWTVKENQCGVQPPLHILQDNFTIRIHLDDTDEQNGALKVIPQSHLKGIIKTGTTNFKKECVEICSVKKGGVMFMKPLLMHASSRTANNRQRRVIHIEFSRCALPEGLQWSELMKINYT